MTAAHETKDDGPGPCLDLVPCREAEPSPEPPAVLADEHRPMKLTVPLLLAAGWGALLTFSVTFLMEDGRSAVVAPDRVALAEEVPAERPVETRVRSVDRAPDAAAKIILVASAAAEAPPSAVPAATTRPPVERVNYVGTWGPHPQACGAQGRRRGYLPAQITEDGAKAGRTLCRFRDGRRDGLAWTVAADCSERGRHWTSQVRLLVDGDRLTWTSAKGSSSYVRCGRRDG